MREQRRGTVAADGADRQRATTPRRSAKWKARRDAIVDTSAQVFARQRLPRHRHRGAVRGQRLRQGRVLLLHRLEGGAPRRDPRPGDGRGDARCRPRRRGRRVAVGAAGDARRRAARRDPPLSRPRVGVPPRVPRAHRRARRAVPPPSARVRAAGRGGAAGRHRHGRVPRRRSVAHRARVARHAQLHVPLAEVRRSVSARDVAKPFADIFLRGIGRRKLRPATGASNPRRPPRVPPIMAAFSSAGTSRNSRSISSRLPRNVPSACG